MAWALLGVAGILEIAFAFFMKSSVGFTRMIPSVLTVATGVSSVVLLSISLRSLPVGTGYAVWTGIGVVGTATLGMVLFAEPATAWRVFFLLLIVCGIVGLRFTASTPG